jgi:hypothetical protein
MRPPGLVVIVVFVVRGGKPADFLLAVVSGISIHVVNSHLSQSDLSLLAEKHINPNLPSSVCLLSPFTNIHFEISAFFPFTFRCLFAHVIHFQLSIFVFQSV